MPYRHVACIHFDVTHFESRSKSGSHAKRPPLPNMHARKFLLPRYWLMIMLLASLLFHAATVNAAYQVEITVGSVFYDYGQQATFQAQIEPADGWSEVNLFLQPQGAPARVEQVTPDSDGGIVYIYDLVEKPLPAFTPVTFWFRVVGQDGDEYTSPEKTFVYDDNRFAWEQLQTEQFEVNWYERDIAFGQQVLNTAEQGLRRVQDYLPGTIEAPVRIFVYSSVEAFQQALQLSTSAWAVGHASPALRTIVVSVPPGPEEVLELERQIPHEMAHIFEYAVTGDGYAQIPTWLLEGTASLAELYPNPDYQSVLDNAAHNKALIPMAQLCGPFPREASAAFLSYAQSASFVRFLHQKYGTSGLGELMQSYADGVGCQEGPQRVWNVSLNELEYRWRQESLGMDMAGLIFGNLLPYIILLALLVLLPLIFALSGGLRSTRGKGAREVHES